jgi:hypothetical protein
MTVDSMAGMKALILVVEKDEMMVVLKEYCMVALLADSKAAL